MASCILGTMGRWQVLVGEPGRGLSGKAFKRSCFHTWVLKDEYKFTYSLSLYRAKEGKSILKRRSSMSEATEM